MYQLLALLFYFSIITAVVLISSRKVKSSADFILGSRSLNFWLTAMAAHASDMSSWLFMGYPAIIYAGGLVNIWVAIGLLICMWLNWQYVAGQMRVLSEKLGCSTISSFLQCRYGDDSGTLRLLSALFCFVFYVVYICSGLVGLGLMGQSLFGISYSVGLILGVCIVVTYVSLGGFLSLAWLDLIQGLFLLGVICFVPIYVGYEMGGWDVVMERMAQSSINFNLFPDTGAAGIITVISLMLGWGLGYFGQPHIITKFMGIKNPSEIAKSRNFGMIWMLLTLMAATVVGFMGAIFFQTSLADPQMVFIEMVKQTFHPFVVGLILCSILAATINVMSSQLLVLSSILTEDIYRKWRQKEPSSKEMLYFSRLWVIAAALFSFGIAYIKISSIYALVHYAWSGLGASFGPLILLGLYSNKLNKYGAIAGLFTGGVTAGLWPYLNAFFPIQIDALVPGFALSCIAIVLVSRLTASRAKVEVLD